MVGVGPASYDGPLHADNVARRVTVRGVGQIGIANVLLGQHGVVHVPAEGCFDPLLPVIDGQQVRGKDVAFYCRDAAFARPVGLRSARNGR